MGRVRRSSVVCRGDASTYMYKALTCTKHLHVQSTYMYKALTCTSTYIYKRLHVQTHNAQSAELNKAVPSLQKVLQDLSGTIYLIK